MAAPNDIQEDNMYEYPDLPTEKIQKTKLKTPSFKKSNDIGAGLEWRAFLRYETAKKLDIFKELRERKHKLPNYSWNRGFVEKRTDNYVVLKDNDYGLKFRYGTNLEIKCRVEEHMNIEGWYKRTFQIHTIEMKLDLLQQKAQKYGKDDDLSTCMELINKENSFIVGCKKERQTSSVDGLSLEQTKCKLQILDSKFIEENDCKESDNDNRLGDIGSLNGSEWISVCVEGSNVEKMLNVAQSVEAIMGKYDENYIVASYPGWLIQLMY